jgi:TonB family protein
MKPLRSADPNPKNVQFSHFGVLNDGASSKGAFLTSMTFNVLVLLLAILVSAAAVNRVKERKDKLTSISLVPKEEPKPPKPPPPKIVPPKPLPEPPKIEPPKIQPPPVQLPPELKPIVVPTPKVNLTPPAPKKVDPPPAPKVVNLAMKASAASVPNHDPNPSPVRLGMNSPVNPTGVHPVSPVNMNNGFSGMPPGNTGSGKPTNVRIQGNGGPTGTNLNGTSVAVVPVKGLNTGVPNGTGTGRNGPVSVQIAPQQQQVAAARPTVVSPMAHPPVITYTPKPIYSAEASAMHLEGEARVSVRLNGNGTVQVLSLVRGLGHGLDQSAMAAAQGIRFKPATDGNGQPVDFPTTVVIRFAIN